MTLTESSRFLTGVMVLMSLLALTLCHLEEERRDNMADGSGQDTQDFTDGIGRLLLKHMRFRDLSDISNTQQQQQGQTYWQDYRPSQTRRSRSNIDDAFMDEGSSRTFLRSTRGDHSSSFLPKRERQARLVDNLAAILTDINKGQNHGSALRMPSLRFG